MDLKLPNIYCKEIRLLDNYENIVKNVEQWFSQYLNTKWTDNHELIKCVLLSYPNCNDINKLILISKSVIWFIILDDHLDKNPNQIEHWLKVFEMKKAIEANDPLEIIFEILINELMGKPFAYSQKLRIMDGLNMFLESYKTSSKIRSGALIPTMAEFTGCRYTDGFMHFLYVMVEFYLNINLSDKWHIDIFRELHVKISEHVLVVNDIYSFKKEMENKDYPEYTYMSVVRKLSNMTFEEALQEAVRRVERLEIEISNLITKVKSLADEIPLEYINGIIDIKDGNLYWSKICKRYNCSN